MPRALRFEYPGARYHVMNRGDRPEPIFRDDADHKRFLATLGAVCQKTDWQIHACCLLHNHLHLVLETPNANLVAGMSWFLSTDTARFNRRHKRFGHRCSGRYKEELDKLGWAGAELHRRAKGDARKIRIAQRLRAETSVTLQWIAAALPMGTWTHVANRLQNTKGKNESHQQAELGLV